MLILSILAFFAAIFLLAAITVAVAWMGFVKQSRRGGSRPGRGNAQPGFNAVPQRPAQQLYFLGQPAGAVRFHRNPESPHGAGRAGLVGGTRHRADAVLRRRRGVPAVADPAGLGRLRRRRRRRVPAVRLHSARPRKTIPRVPRSVSRRARFHGACAARGLCAAGRGGHGGRPTPPNPFPPNSRRPRPRPTWAWAGTGLWRIWRGASRFWK